MLLLFGCDSWCSHSKIHNLLKLECFTWLRYLIRRVMLDWFVVLCKWDTGCNHWANQWHLLLALVLWVVVEFVFVPVASYNFRWHTTIPKIWNQTPRVVKRHANNQTRYVPLWATRIIIDQQNQIDVAHLHKASCDWISCCLFACAIKNC